MASRRDLIKVVGGNFPIEQYADGLAALDSVLKGPISRRGFAKAGLAGLAATVAACGDIFGPDPIDPSISMSVEPEEVYGRDTVEINVSGEPGTEGSSITSVVINGREYQGASHLLEELLENRGSSPAFVTYDGAVNQSDGLSAQDSRDVVVNPARPPNLDAVVASPSTVYGGGQVNLAGDVSADVFMEQVAVDEDDDGSVEATYQNAEDDETLALSHALSLENESDSDLEKRVNVHAVDEWGNSNERVFNIIVKPYVRGVVSDIFSGAAVSGGVVRYEDKEFDIQGDGSFKAAMPSDGETPLSIEAEGYAPRDTYLAHRTDGGFVLIPAEYIDDVAEIVWKHTDDSPRPLVKWEAGVTPTIVINPDGFTDEALENIESVCSNYLSSLSNGRLANATSFDYRSGFVEFPPEEDGIIAFYKSGFTNGTKLKTQDSFIKSFSVRLTNGLTYPIIVHEVGHGVGMWGHYNEDKDSIMNTNIDSPPNLGSGELAPIDQRNATVIFTMPAGSEYEDNRQVDPAP